MGYMILWWREKDFKLSLCRQVVAILKELQKYTGQGRLLFPGIRTPARTKNEL